MGASWVVIKTIEMVIRIDPDHVQTFSRCDVPVLNGGVGAGSHQDVLGLEAARLGPPAEWS